MSPRPDTVVFDLGNVLIGWDPRALYRKLFESHQGNDPREPRVRPDKPHGPDAPDAPAAKAEWFLANVCTPAWNLELDRGRSFASAVEELTQRHPPELHPLIRAYHERWPEMLTGELSETVAVLERLSARHIPLYALTNWSAETFPFARERYAFLKHFRGIVVSGEEGCIKPEPTIYQRLLVRYQLDPRQCVFIDDSLANVRGAEAVGLHAIHFRDAPQLTAALAELGFAL